MFKGKDFPTQLDAIAQVLGTSKLKAYADKYKEFMNTEILSQIGNHPGVSFESLVTPENKHKATPLAIDLLKKMLIYDPVRKLIKNIESPRNTELPLRRLWNTPISKFSISREH